MVFVLKVTGELPEVLSGIPSDALDKAVFTNRSYLTAEAGCSVWTFDFETQMGDIFRVAEEVAEAHIVARRFIFAYLFMLMIKFFKAFGVSTIRLRALTSKVHAWQAEDSQNPDKCIPYTTYSGWLEPSGIQKIFTYNTAAKAIAYGEAASWGTYVSNPRNFRLLSYWWSPATEFSDMRAEKLVFPGPSNLPWLVTRIDFSNQDFEVVMGNLQANWAPLGGLYDSSASFCTFGCLHPANLAKILAWIPNDLECAAGTGTNPQISCVRTADGGYEVTTRDEASYCEWCPPGRFSNPVLLTSTSSADIQTYRCDACPPGQKQSTGGSTFCEDCFSTEFALKLLAPLYGGLLFLGMYWVSKCCKRLTLDRDIVIGTYGSFFVAFFISITNLSLKLFQTYSHPNGERSMISEPAVITNSQMWLSMVAGTTLAILLYCAGATASIVYALYNAPTFYKEGDSDPGFRKRWKFLFLSVRPSAYWWITASMVKARRAFFLSLTTVAFQRPMAQTIWLGTGRLMLYFLAVFWFLPWRTATLLWLDVALHYLLAVLCLLMPFFVPANATELMDAAYIFLVMNDAKLIADVLHGLVDVDYTLTVNVMKILSVPWQSMTKECEGGLLASLFFEVELLGNTESGRLIWRRTLS
eukprot:Skav212601  [mRNA]  locus=scaffold2176:36422:82683:- [translate_table: standard]